ncbi:hypothetical protein K469DRAFT_798636, partial [Zopfia rhizophila CBS 207.26]
AMHQRTKTQSIHNKGRLSLAIFAIKKSQLQSVRQAATVYNVPEPTLRRRLAGTTFRRDCEANSKKLNKLEESV